MEKQWKYVGVCVQSVYTLLSASTKPSEMPHSQLISVQNTLCITCITPKYMGGKD